MAYNKEITFTVAGRETSDERLLISIPRQYHDLFEVHNFKDMHELSLALMHASCAAEAAYYGRMFKYVQYENDMLRTLGMPVRKVESA